jgi:vancomycin resistance protein YoaR
VRPQVDEDDVRTALSDVMRPALSGPVTLELSGEEVRLPVVAYAPAFSMTVVDGELTPRLDAEVLARRLRPLMQRLDAQPRDATVVLRGGKPVVLPDRPGIRIDPAEVARKVLPALTATGKDRVAEVRATTAQAEFRTADARALRIRQPVSSFVTYYPHAHYRNVNQARAAQLISGTVLRSGDTFSFNGTVGERTRANGFIKGFIISDGAFAEDLGGGVSQVVTTTFNAAFFAGLKDVEHTPHSFYIDRYPAGREATVAWPTVDLKFQNTTPYGVLIEAWVVPSTPSRSGEMHVRMWSTKYWDIRAGASERYNFTSPGTRTDSSKQCVAQTGVPGFEIDVYRFFRKAGSPQLVRKETMHTTYLPADTINCTR